MKKLLESIALYVIRKILEYFEKKYKVEKISEKTLEKIASKIEK